MVDVVDSSQAIVPAAYRAAAAEMSKAGGIEYRYGPYVANTDSAPSWWKRDDIEFTKAQQPNAGGPVRGFWQIGAWQPDPGDYYSNIANAGFVADNPAQYSGVSTLGTTSMGANTFAQSPQLSWVFGGTGDEDPNIASYKSAKLDANNAVAMARCSGRPGWCLESIVAFQNGLLGVATGSNTAQNRATTQLAPGLVPTGIAVTNSNEFALVTVWDTVALRGRVAVVALAGICNGCSLTQAGAEDYWGEWGTPHPGLPNYGNTAFMKVLGYVDLPGMQAPTEISVTTGWNPWDGRTVDAGAGTSYVNAFHLPLSEAANRASFLTGANNKAYAKAGVAVVISKSEKKAAFIDLKPLFAYYQKMYFTDANYPKTTNLGQATGQWPYTFAEEASQLPTVIKTVSLDQKPTAVKTYLWGSTKRAWIATQDGSLRIFDLGDYPTSGTGSAASIRQTGSVAVGKNPTGLAYSRSSDGVVTGNAINTNLLVVSRAERKVDWVSFGSDGNSGTITRTLRDSRLIDPITADDNESHGTEAYVLSVADYNGKAISNYRYGPVIFRTNVRPGWSCQPPAGCPTTDSTGRAAAFEFGGSFATKGKAFAISSANVP